MKKSILVMDQDFTFLGLYNHILPKQKFHIIKCRKIDWVMKFISSIKVDLIICDGDKPDRCGIQILEMLEAAHSKIPVIIVSGGFYPSEEIIITKAFAFLSKVEILERLPDLIADDSPVWKELVNV